MDTKYLGLTANKLARIATELDAENARLRDMVEEDDEQLDIWQKKAEYYSQLSQLAEAENAKMRELIADMWNDAVTRMDFVDRHEFIGEFVNRVSKMGVEVDDGQPEL